MYAIRSYYESRIGPLSDTERAERITRSPLKGKYDTVIDRESAYEVLRQRAERKQADQETVTTPQTRTGQTARA